MDNLSKHCVVTFDEMSLRQELKYNPHRDEVDGVVHRTQRQPEVCNQALVFMIRGLAKNWKQPISFYFSKNAASGFHLRLILYAVLESLFQIDLKPVIIVCDQGPCNRSLYNLLGVTASKPHFQVSTSI